MGGGSIECAVGANGALQARASVEVGAVSLAERYPTLMGNADPAMARTAAGAARDAVATALAPFAELRPVDEVRIVGGTATTLAAIDGAPAGRSGGHLLTRAAIDAIVERLLRLDLAGRLGVPGMVVQRADILPAGAIILSEALARLGAAAARVGMADSAARVPRSDGSASASNG